jgi:hypothetical protein
LAAGTILTANLASDSVTQVKIADGACSSANKTTDLTPTTPITGSYVAYATQAITTAASAGPVLIQASMEVRMIGAQGQNFWAFDMRITRNDGEIYALNNSFEYSADRNVIPQMSFLDTGLNDLTTYTYKFEVREILGSGTNTTDISHIMAIEFRR